jgi:nitrogen-specific signal transduction histidine kinase
VSAADATRVQQARERLASFPSDAELARMSAVELVTWCVRMQGAAQLLDAYVREAEADDARDLREIRDLLARFDWEHDDRQLALEAIERIVDGGQA